MNNRISDFWQLCDLIEELKVTWVNIVLGNWRGMVSFVPWEQKRLFFPKKKYFFSATVAFTLLWRWSHLTSVDLSSISLLSVIVSGHVTPYFYLKMLIFPIKTSVCTEWNKAMHIKTLFLYDKKKLELIEVFPPDLVKDFLNRRLKGKLGY